MKSIFNFLLFFVVMPTFLQSMSAHSREVILIENKASQSEGLILKKILFQRFHLPLELITLKKIKDNCERKSDAIIHLCLEENGDLKVIELNQYVIQNSFGVFLNSKEGEKNEIL
jgi:hypothetical protein